MVSLILIVKRGSEYSVTICEVCKMITLAHSQYNYFEQLTSVFFTDPH